MKELWLVMISMCYGFDQAPTWRVFNSERAAVAFVNAKRDYGGCHFEIYHASATLVDRCKSPATP